MDITLDFPFGGVSEELALAKQVPGTTRSAANVMGQDPVTGRIVGAQRKGFRKYLGQPLVAGSAVQALEVCVFDSKQTDYAELASGSEVLKWSSNTTAGEAASQIVLDSQKNSYAVEGRSTIVKRNSDGKIVWTHQVGMPAPKCLIVALAIDLDTDELYTGPGTTPDQFDAFAHKDDAKGFIVKLVQEKDNKVKVAWKHEIEGFISNLAVVEGELYLTRDRPDRGQSILERYDGLAGSAPTRAQDRRIPFPCSGMAVRKDGVVYTTHPANVDRGKDPRARGSTAKTLPENMWNPSALKKVEITNSTFGPRKVLWSWHLADDLQDPAGEALDDRAAVLTWPDRSGNGRDLGQAFHVGNLDLQPEAPRLVYESLGAEPGVRFYSPDLPSDTSNASQQQSASGMSSAANMTTHLASAEQQESLLPAFSGNRHLAVFLVRAPIRQTMSPLLYQINDHQNQSGQSSPDNRLANQHGLFFNMALSGATATTQAGTLTLIDSSSSTISGAKSTPMDTDVGMHIVTVMYGGNNTGGYPSYSSWRVNGKEIGRFNADDFYGLTQTYLGWSPFFTGNGTVVERYFSGDVLEIVTCAFEDANAIEDQFDWLGTAQKIEGYMAHRVGYSHKLDPLHPYHVSKGPPPQDSASPVATLQSPLSILAKWASGRFTLKAAYTGSAPIDASYGVAAQPEIEQGITPDHIFVTGLNPVSGKVQLSCVRDTGSAFDVSPFSLGNWTRDLFTDKTLNAGGGVIGYSAAMRTRMAVDGWGNVYVPIRTDDANPPTVRGFDRYGAPVGGMVNPDLDVGANAVACQAAKDDYGRDSVPRTEALWIAAELPSTASAEPYTYRQPAVHRVHIVSATPNGASPREVLTVGVAGGSIRIFSSTGGVEVPLYDTGVSDPTLSSTAYIATVAAFNKVFFTDGRVVCYLDCKLRKVFAWTAKDGGKLPTGFKLLSFWRGRIVFGRGQDDNATNWYMLKQGNPFNAEERPDDPNDGQAVGGNNAKAGKPGDIITALVPWDEDTLLMGGDHSIWRLTGDPMAGGTVDRLSSRLDTMSPNVGFGFGQSWCQNREGLLYLHDNVGAVHVMTPGAMPKNITKGRVETTMRGVDLSNFRPLLVYDNDARVVHVFYAPYSVADASASTTHFLFEEDTQSDNGAWWPVTFGSVGLQPMCATVLDGDLPADRVVLIGCQDGYVRTLDSTAADDDGTAIASTVLIGPLAPEESEMEYEFKRTEIILATAQGGASCAQYASDRADFLGSARRTWLVGPGRNPPTMDRVRGAYVALEIGSRAVGNRWALGGSIHMQVNMRGRKRIRQ